MSAGDRKPAAAPGASAPGYGQLFLTFCQLGLFTIGGGMAMIPLMQGRIVDKKGWMTEEEMVDCLAVSQSLPGVIAINMATYIGREKKNLLGAVVATAGVVLPSFLIIIAVIRLLAQIGDDPYVQGALVGCKAAAAGLIAYAAWKVGSQVLRSAFAWVLGLAAFGAVTFAGINALWAVLAGIVAGILYSRYAGKAAAREGAGVSRGETGGSLGKGGSS